MTVFWLADQNGRLYTPPRRTELLGNSLASRTNQGTERNVVNSKCSPDTSLFRQQAVEQKKARLHGDSFTSAHSPLRCTYHFNRLGVRHCFLVCSQHLRPSRDRRWLARTLGGTRSCSIYFPSKKLGEILPEVAQCGLNFESAFDAAEEAQARRRACALRNMSGGEIKSVESKCSGGASKRQGDVTPAMGALTRSCDCWSFYSGIHSECKSFFVKKQ